MVRVDKQPEELLFKFYDDEIRFSGNEFIGLTIEEGKQVHFIKDRAYLQS